MMEADVLERIDAWVRAGGTVIYPASAARVLTTIEGDHSVYKRWLSGDCGRGQVVLYRSDCEPAGLYARFVWDALLKAEGLDERTQRMLRLNKPDTVFAASYENGRLVLLNFSEEEAAVMDGDARLVLEPFEIRII